MNTRFHNLIAMLALVGAVSTVQAQESLKPVTVVSERAHVKSALHAYTLDCTPPNSAASCADFHRAIRRNFSSREIGMLFGASTAYFESVTSYGRVSERFDDFARVYDAQHLTAFANKQ